MLINTDKLKNKSLISVVTDIVHYTVPFSVFNAGSLTHWAVLLTQATQVQISNISSFCVVHSASIKAAKKADCH